VLQFYDPTFVYKGKKDNTLECEPSNQDLTDSTYQYFGYVNPRTGAWIIQRFHIIASAIIYEYSQGRIVSHYVSCWNGATGRYIGALTFYRIDQAVPL
jgi:hypothetical protein